MIKNFIYVWKEKFELSLDWNWNFIDRQIDVKWIKFCAFI